MFRNVKRSIGFEKILGKGVTDETWLVFKNDVLNGLKVPQTKR